MKVGGVYNLFTQKTCLACQNLAFVKKCHTKIDQNLTMDTLLVAIFPPKIDAKFLRK